MDQILNFVNLLLSAACGWSAVCRLGLMTHRVHMRAVLLYLALFVGAWLSGFQFFFFGTLAGWSDVTLSAVVLSLLVTSWPRWRRGVPAELLRA